MGQNWLMAITATGCSTPLFTFPDSCGCSLTRASIQAITPTDIENMANKEYDVARIVMKSAEARMLGVVEPSLFDLLNSRLKPRSGGPNNGSIIAPFEMIPQRSRINVTAFQIQSAVATTGAGTGGIPASAWDVTVIINPSPWASAVPNLERYFKAGNYVNVRYVDSANGNVTRNLIFAIYGNAVNADSGGVSKARVTLVPNVTDTRWGTLTNGEKAILHPTHGNLVTMANSVSDYESWCHNSTSDMSLGLRIAWRQTSRFTHCYSSEYQEALKAPNVNAYWNSFKVQQIAEQRKQQLAAEAREWLNTLVFGDQINETQAVATYTNLPRVYDPANPSCHLEYKSNTLGVHRQLVDCGRVIDSAGGALDMDVVLDASYTLMRHRRSAGKANYDRVEYMTDRFTRGKIFTLMAGYYKAKYGITTLTGYAKIGEKMTFNGMVAWTYDEYELPELGFTLVIIGDEFFNDHLLTYASADKSAGRHMLSIDWSDIDVWLYGTSSVERKTNELDNLYNCVIKIPTSRYFLQSKTFAVFVPDPNQHVWFTGFADTCPTMDAVTPCNPGS